MSDLEVAARAASGGRRGGLAKTNGMIMKKKTNLSRKLKTIPTGTGVYLMNNKLL